MACQFFRRGEKQKATEKGSDRVNRERTKNVFSQFFIYGVITNDDAGLGRGSFDP